MKPKTNPRKVDWINNSWDLELRIAAELGMSTKYIMRSCDLTYSQVGYRIGLAGIKRKDARDGETPLIKKVLRESHALAEHEVLKQITNK